MEHRKKIFIPLVLLIIIGSFLLSDAELGTTRAVDIVQLIVFGMLLGVLIVNLVAKFRKK